MYTRKSVGSFRIWIKIEYRFITDLTEFFTTVQNFLPLCPGDGHPHVVLGGDPLSDLRLEVKENYSGKVNILSGGTLVLNAHAKPLKTQNKMKI